MALIGVGVLVVLAAAAQVALPRIAASRISSRVGRYGRVESVSVSAWPAVKLLWGDADSVSVRAGSLSVSPQQAAGLLWEGRSVSRMDLSASSVRLGSLVLADAHLSQRGDELRASARVSEEAVRAALPAGVEVSLVGSGQGKVEVQAGGTLFGVGASVRAVAEGSEGKLVAHPVGFLLEAFRLTLFSNPHVYVEEVGASQTGSPPTYELRMGAKLL